MSIVFDRNGRLPVSFDALVAENKRRVKCPVCPLKILPETLDRHLRVCHTNGRKPKRT